MLRLPPVHLRFRCVCFVRVCPRPRRPPRPVPSSLGHASPASSLALASRRPRSPAFSPSPFHSPSPAPRPVPRFAVLFRAPRAVAQILSYLHHLRAACCHRRRLPAPPRRPPAFGLRPKWPFGPIQTKSAHYLSQPSCKLFTLSIS